MALNYGKKFEGRFKTDFLKSVPGGTLNRLYDPTNGFVTIKNICDFIGYAYPNIYYLEIKSHRGNTFPLTNLSQYEKLAEKEGIKGVRAGVVIWFIDNDKVWYVPISTITKMKKDNKKSVNSRKDIELGYNIVEIPSRKKRVFMESNYSVLLKLKDGE